MRKRVLVSLLFVGVILTAFNARADFYSGLTAYDAGDYKKAYEEWNKEAYNDNWAAQRNLAHLYRWGKGVEKDESRAAYWYHRAAKGGFDRAQYNLGCLYLEGVGVPKDEMEGLKWLKKAADQGNEAAKLKINEILTANPSIKVPAVAENEVLKDPISADTKAEMEKLKNADSGNDGEEASVKEQAKAKEAALKEDLIKKNMEKEASIKRKAGVISAKDKGFEFAGNKEPDVRIKASEKVVEAQKQTEDSEKSINEKLDVLDKASKKIEEDAAVPAPKEEEAVAEKPAQPKGGAPDYEQEIKNQIQGKNKQKVETVAPQTTTAASSDAEVNAAGTVSPEPTPAPKAPPIKDAHKLAKAHEEPPKVTEPAAKEENAALGDDVAYAHLESYGNKESANKGWSMLQKKYDLSSFTKVEKEVVVKGKNYIRVYAAGPKDAVLHLCSQFKGNKEYCQFYSKP